mgnify:CR=1 FL=1
MVRSKFAGGFKPPRAAFRSALFDNSPRRDEMKSAHRTRQSTLPNAMFLVAWCAACMAFPKKKEDR